MFSIKLIVGFALFACVFSEPPRKRFNFRFNARQEAAVDDAAPVNPQDDQGYNYQAPEGEQLRLPIKFQPFARQEKATGGYSYPKPDYGLPETTETPSTEYGTPDSTQNPDNEDEAVTEDTTTDNPESERLRGIQASQIRRKNAKLSRNQKSTQFNARLINADVQFQPQVQPIYFVDYPTAEFVQQPQYVYLVKWEATKDEQQSFYNK